MAVVARRPNAAPARLQTDTGRWRVAGVVTLAVAALLYGFPLFWMISTSFKSMPDITTFHWLPSDPGLEPYRKFFRTDFLPALRNSVEISGLTVLISLALAVPAGYGLARSRSRLLTPLLLILLLVQMIPTSATFIPLFRLLNQLGLVDTELGVALALASLMVPFAILLLRPAFAGIPRELEEAASVDGAGSARYVVRVAIPLLRNSIFVTAAIILVSAWAELVYPLTFLLDEEKYPLSVYIAQSVGRFNNAWNSLMAVSVMASLPVLAVVLGAQNQLRRGLTLGSVK